MNKVTIYRFRFYDIGNDEMTTSRRWGAREAIKHEVLENTAVEIEVDAVESDIPGLTEWDYVPARCKEDEAFISWRYNDAICRMSGSGICVG